MKLAPLAALLVALALPSAGLAATCRPVPENAKLEFELEGTVKMLAKSLGKLTCRDLVVIPDTKVVLLKLEHTGTTKEIWRAVRLALREKGLDLFRSEGCRYEIKKIDGERALKDNYDCKSEAARPRE